MRLDNCELRLCVGVTATLTVTCDLSVRKYVLLQLLNRFSDFYQTWHEFKPLTSPSFAFF